MGLYTLVLAGSGWWMSKKVGYAFVALYLIYITYNLVSAFQPKDVYYA